MQARELESIDRKIHSAAREGRGEEEAQHRRRQETSEGQEEHVRDQVEREDRQRHRNQGGQRDDRCGDQQAAWRRRSAAEEVAPEVQEAARAGQGQISVPLFAY